MKFNNENAKEQMAYVAPRVKAINVQPQGVICGSIEQDYSGEDANSQTEWSGSESWGIN